MTQKPKTVALIISILAGTGLALIFSQVASFKELPTQIQVLLAGTTSTAVEGVPGAYLALAAAFAVGLSMVVTPCFLPILLTFAPTLQTKERPDAKKLNWLLNLFWYGAGLVLVGALVGAVVGFLGGQFIPILAGLSASAMLTAVIVFTIVGLVVLYFGLAELDMVPQRRLLSGTFHWAQQSGLKLRGYRKSFAVGATMGGALGVGCPFPTYHAILLWAAIVGSPAYGALLGAVLALGRILPLLLFGLLARLRVSPRTMMDWIGEKNETVHLVSGIGLVVLGVFSIVFWALLVGTQL